MKNLFIAMCLIMLVPLMSYSANEKQEKHLKIKEDDITSQPFKVELIDNKTSQSQNALSLKVANDVKLYSIKVGDKILFTMPSTLNITDGTNIPAGTKFSATVVLKKGNKIKIIINEIIFTDTKNYIILSSSKGIQPLKTISAERILGKNAKVSGTLRLGTVISSVTFSQSGIKAEPDTTTAVGICILITTRVRTINAGTPVVINFEKNIKPEVGLLK